jgi:hypothetical protein
MPQKSRTLQELKYEIACATIQSGTIQEICRSLQHHCQQFTGGGGDFENL